MQEVAAPGAQSFRGCLATILELPFDDVPEPAAGEDPATGGFVLTTPHPGAAKFMPNTSAAGGPKTAVVAARLISDGTDQGVSSSSWSASPTPTARSRA